MDCPDCGAEVIPFAVPADLREYVPGGEAAVALCSNCLALSPIEEPPDGEPDLTAVSTAFPDDPETAIELALLVGLLSSLALYRSEVSDLLARVERAGTDPLLALNRLADDPSLEPAVDLRRRRHQLEQLLE